jgi:hypothetical protein
VPDGLLGILGHQGFERRCIQSRPEVRDG